MPIMLMHEMVHQFLEQTSQQVEGGPAPVTQQQQTVCVSSVCTQVKF